MSLYRAFSGTWVINLLHDLNITWILETLELLVTPCILFQRLCFLFWSSPFVTTITHSNIIFVSSEFVLNICVVLFQDAVIKDSPTSLNKYYLGFSKVIWNNSCKILLETRGTTDLKIKSTIIIMMIQDLTTTRNHNIKGDVFTVWVSFTFPLHVYYKTPVLLHIVWLF